MQMNKTLTVSIFGKSKEIEIHGYHLEGTLPSNFFSEKIIACVIGNGEKVHRGSLTLWVYETRADACKQGHRSEYLYEVDGIVLALSRTSYARNRQAQVIGWAEDYKGKEVATKQEYYGSL